METTCAATDLPRVSDRDWSPQDVARFVTLASKGTVAVDLSAKGTAVLDDCALPGRYERYPGKGAGHLWATNRPLLRAEELGRGCARGTHLVAAFARRDARFEAVLVPLPCPPITDIRPARGCVGKGLTGSQRLARGRALQERLDPGGATLPRPTAAREDSGEWSRHAPPPLPQDSKDGRGKTRLSNGWLLGMWALTPDDYPATRWLNRLAGDCALAAQGAWLDSAYAWGGTHKAPHTVVLPKPAPPSLQQGHLSLKSCLARPVFPHCFPDIVTLDPGCMRL